jgi:TIR domain
MAGIFVSYTSSDREWEFWIAKELNTLRHLPHVHYWEIKSSDDGWMEQRHDAADHVLCVISDDYLKAPYSRWNPTPRCGGPPRSDRLRSVDGGEPLQTAHVERSSPTL